MHHDHSSPRVHGPVAARRAARPFVDLQTIETENARQQPRNSFDM
jgi:hypothetical protein